MKQIPSRRHQAGIPSGVYRRGFAKALRHLCRVHMGRYPIVPDGFTVEKERRRITIYEVIVTHEIDATKLDKIRDIRACVRLAGWMLRPMVGGGSDGKFWPMDMRNGKPAITQRELNAAVRLLDRVIR